MSKTMLYRYPGPHNIDGKGFDYIVVEDDDIDEYCESGWSLTTAEALEIAEPVPSDADSDAGDVGSKDDSDEVKDLRDKMDGLRSELSDALKRISEEGEKNRAFFELVANSAEIKFNKSISDVKLREKITAAIEEGLEEGDEGEGAGNELDETEAN